MRQAEPCSPCRWILGWGPMAARLLGELELLLACCIPAELSVGSRGAWDGGHGPQQVAVFLLSITSWRAGAWFCLFFSSLFKNSFTVITALLMFERQVSTLRVTARLKKQTQWFRRREPRVIFFFFPPLFFPSLCRHPLQPYLLIAAGLEQPGCRKSPQRHRFVKMAMPLLYNDLGKDGSSAES